MSSQVFGRRRRFTIVPIYACMSGGQVADLGDRVHIGVPASALEPVRRTRDATFVADRARILAEPTRVRILIHLMQGPSGVMQMTRALGMTQPTVSEHVRVLAAAGLIRRQDAGSRRSYVASWSRARRVIDDMHGTLARWAGVEDGDR
jgi:ArsR family transcriptional regulator